tara:strand:- start:1379 stop:2155 length:777 start_codon:yes stop_codon:yes gene_type:complete
MQDINNLDTLNNLYKKGYVIIEGVFNSDQIKELHKPLKLERYSKYISSSLNMRGFKTKKNITDYLKYLNSQTVNEKIIKNTKKIFETTNFFKNKMKYFSNIDWNALRVNVPNDKYKNVHWHQDIQTPLENKQDFYKNKFFTFWIPFTSVSEKNSIEILPYSNKNIVFNNHYRKDIPIPKIYKKNKSIKVKINAGDLVILDNFTFHKSILNTSKLLRISVDLRYSNNKSCNLKIHYRLKSRIIFESVKGFLKYDIIKIK